jgi:hypothetical protein
VRHEARKAQLVSRPLHGQPRAGNFARWGVVASPYMRGCEGIAVRPIALGLALVLSPAVSPAANLNCHGPSNVEEFRYTWRIRGGLSFVAGFLFPTSGIGDLKTTYPKPGENAIDCELLITPPDGPGGGFFVYQSQMDAGGDKTLMTYHGYSWGSKSRKERTIFDYVKRLARMHKETSTKTEDQVKPLPPEQMRDMLTAIHFLRQNATRITAPVSTIIYSDGKEYEVVFRQIERRTFSIENRNVEALGFEIVDGPGGRRWPGGVRVWVSNDARRIPFRIEIRQPMASLELNLQSVESCAFMQAGM